MASQPQTYNSAVSPTGSQGDFVQPSNVTTDAQGNTVGTSPTGQTLYQQPDGSWGAYPSSGAGGASTPSMAGINTAASGGVSGAGIDSGGGAPAGTPSTGSSSGSSSVNTTQLPPTQDTSSVDSISAVLRSLGQTRPPQSQRVFQSRIY